MAGHFIWRNVTGQTGRAFFSQIMFPPHQHLWRWRRVTMQFGKPALFVHRKAFGLWLLRFCRSPLIEIRWKCGRAQLWPIPPSRTESAIWAFSANGCYQKSKRHEWLLWWCLGEIQDVFLSYFDRWYWSVCSTRLRDGTPCPYLPIVSGLPLRLIGLRLLKKIYSSSMLPLAEERPVTMSLVL